MNQGCTWLIVWRKCSVDLDDHVLVLGLFSCHWPTSVFGGEPGKIRTLYLESLPTSEYGCSWYYLPAPLKF